MLRAILLFHFLLQGAVAEPQGANDGTPSLGALNAEGEAQRQAPPVSSGKGRPGPVGPGRLGPWGPSGKGGAGAKTGKDGKGFGGKWAAPWPKASEPAAAPPAASPEASEAPAASPAVSSDAAPAVSSDAAPAASSDAAPAVSSDAAPAASSDAATAVSSDAAPAASSDAAPAASSDAAPAAPVQLPIGPVEIWQPKAGVRFQIVLGEKIIKLDKTTPLVPDAEVFDVDLFHTPKSVIQELNARGKSVVCYFSAGGSEEWRPDDKEFLNRDRGDPMREWEGEKWLDIRSPDVFRVMSKRIELAYDKGCKGIDPDNLDAFNHESGRGGGFIRKLTKQDTVAYVKRLSEEAGKYGMSMGLKNAEELLDSVLPYINFAVNEECASMANSEGCEPYSPLIRAGKPVFHIEYAKWTPMGANNVTIRSDKMAYMRYTSDALEQLYCLNTTLRGMKRVPGDVAPLFSTVIKVLGLDGWVLYCDGKWGVTVTTTTGAENLPNQGRGGKGGLGGALGGRGGALGGRGGALGGRGGALGGRGGFGGFGGRGGGTDGDDVD